MSEGLATAPERFWVDRHDIDSVTEPEQFDPDYVEYVRADLRQREIEQLRGALAEMVGMTWLWTTYHLNVEHGNYYECRICKGEGISGKLVSTITHTPECWISRTNKFSDKTGDQPIETRYISPDDYCARMGDCRLCPNPNGNCTCVHHAPDTPKEGEANG